MQVCVEKERCGKLRGSGVPRSQQCPEDWLEIPWKGPCYRGA